MGYINKIKIFGSEVLPPPDIVILSTGRGGGAAYCSTGRTTIRSPLSLPSHAASLYGTLSLFVSLFQFRIFQSQRKPGTFPGTAVVAGDRTLKPGTVPGNRRRLVTLLHYHYFGCRNLAASVHTGRTRMLSVTQRVNPSP